MRRYYALRSFINRKNAIKLIGLVLAVGICIFNFMPSMRSIRALPTAVFAENEEDLRAIISEFSNNGGYETTVSDIRSETLSEKQISIRLLGVFNLKTIPVYLSKRSSVHPCGDAIGISIRTKGLLVVGNGSILNRDGKKCTPSADAGLRPGDIIMSVNDIEVNTSSELQRAIDLSSGTTTLAIERNAKLQTINVVPVITSDGSLKIGAWVRDSTVGIGTLSFYDPQSGYATALGHAVIDMDTGKIIKVRNGEMRKADVIGIKKGKAGTPGELQGSFDSGYEMVSSIQENDELGIRGYLTESMMNEASDYILPVAFPDEVKKGKAYILSTIGESGVKRYSCNIVKVIAQSEPDQKGMIIEITDENLLDRAGGIVQGMSGSPIIQDGKLIGVTTHVFVNDPTKGYAVYAYWMMDRNG